MASPMTTRRGGPRSTGVTLTEVVVGSALLVAAIVPLLRALTIAQRTGTVIERRTKCLILAEAKLDEVRARSIHHYESSFRDDSEDLGDSYLCTVADDEDPTLRLLTVSVGCDANADRRLEDTEVEVSLATYLARRQ